MLINPTPLKKYFYLLLHTTNDNKNKEQTYEFVPFWSKKNEAKLHKKTKQKQQQRKKKLHTNEYMFMSEIKIHKKY